MCQYLEGIRDFFRSLIEIRIEFDAKFLLECVQCLHEVLILLRIVKESVVVFNEWQDSGKSLRSAHGTTVEGSIYDGISPAP